MSTSSTALDELFRVKIPIIGMVHLRPLPGSPGYSDGTLESVIDSALLDAVRLRNGGVDGVIVENFMDVPFLKPSEIGFETVSGMSVIAREVRKETGLPTGISCLANGVLQALAIAQASAASFIRANQWANAYIADEGYIEAAAPEAMRYRKSIGAQNIRVLADVAVKHGSHFIVSDRTIEELSKDIEFFKADAVVVSGPRTGKETRLDEVQRVKSAVSIPVMVGSGLNPTNAKKLLRVADGGIVGTWLKKDGVVSSPVDEERVKQFMSSVRKIRPR